MKFSLVLKVSALVVLGCLSSFVTSLVMAEMRPRAGTPAGRVARDDRDKGGPSGRTPKPRTRPGARPTAAAVGLEGRQSPAGRVVLDGGLLIIRASDAGEIATVRLDGDQLFVQKFGSQPAAGYQQRAFAADRVRSIRFVGGAGNDCFVNATSIPSVAFGGPGDDCLYGPGGGNHFSGGPGRNFLIAGDGHNTLVGGPLNDVIVAGGGNNRLSGGSGVNSIFGIEGVDHFIGGKGTDHIRDVQTLRLGLGAAPTGSDLDAIIRAVGGEQSGAPPTDSGCPHWYDVICAIALAAGCGDVPNQQTCICGAYDTCGCTLIQCH